MAKRTIVLEEAWIDTENAGNYYEQISLKLRKRFEEEFVFYL